MFLSVQSQLFRSLTLKVLFVILMMPSIITAQSLMELAQLNQKLQPKLSEQNQQHTPTKVEAPPKKQPYKEAPLSKIELYFFNRANTLKKHHYTIYSTANENLHPAATNSPSFSQALLGQPHKKLNFEESLTSKNALSPHVPTQNITRQFGYTVFENRHPNTINLNQIPISDTYLLGPGDQLSIQVWGKIEEQFHRTIDKKGRIYLPKIGFINLLGAPLGKSTQLIKSALQKHYINFDVSVSLTSVKTIKVFVLGSVKYPGAFEISSLSTAFSALFHAGGPTKEGSLRTIQLRRGKRVIKAIDLYDYLLKGNKNADIQLKAMDTLFIPPIGDVVQVKGPVKRPGIFEIKNNVNAKEVLMSYAGGFSIGASSHYVRIDKDSPNNLLSFIDISTDDYQKTLSQLETITPSNGDSINVVKKPTIQKNTITLQGEVVYPGQYQFKEDLTLSTVIQKSGGFSLSAYPKQIELFRYVTDTQQEVIFINYHKTPDFKLKEWDTIKIPSQQDILGVSYVYIDGNVQHPGQYQLLSNMTANDLVLLARPLINSNLSSIEIYRKNSDSSETLLTSSQSDLQSSPVLLEPNDHVLIRSKQSLTRLKKVSITGEVQYPGTYIARYNEKLSSIIERAGGYTKDAFLAGAIFTRKNVQKSESSGHQQVLEEEQKRLVFDHRKSEAISADYQVIYANAIAFLEQKINESKGRMVISLKPLQQFTHSSSDIIIEDGDTLVIPETPETIQVVGGVQQPTAILYKKGKSPQYYIQQSGSYTEFARKNKHYVFKANGTVQMNAKTVSNGDTIYVPEKVKVHTNWLGIFSSITTTLFNILSSLKLTQII